MIFEIYLGNWLNGLRSEFVFLFDTFLGIDYFGHAVMGVEVFALNFFFFETCELNLITSV